MWKWLNPALWPALYRRSRYREALALQLWQLQPEVARRADDIAPLRAVSDQVRQLEALPLSGAATDAADKALLPPDSAAAQTFVQGLRTLAARLRGESVALPPALTFRQMQAMRKPMSSEGSVLTQNLGAHLPVLIPLMSAFLLISGFIYNVMLFDRFDMPVTPFFGLSDHLAASLKGVAASLLAVSFSLVMPALMAGRMRIAVLGELLGTGRINLALAWMLGALLYLAIPLIPGMAKDVNAIPLMRAYVILIIVGSSLAAPIAARAARPLLVSALVTFVTIYFAVLWFGASIAHNRLSRQVDVPTAEITFADDNKPVRRSIVSGSSLYLFLLDAKGQIEAVPIEQVRSVRYLPTAELEREREARKAADAVNNQQVQPITPPRRYRLGVVTTEGKTTSPGSPGDGATQPATASAEP